MISSDAARNNVLQHLNHFAAKRQIKLWWQLFRWEHVSVTVISDIINQRSEWTEDLSHSSYLLCNKSNYSLDNHDNTGSVRGSLCLHAREPLRQLLTCIVFQFLHLLLLVQELETRRRAASVLFVCLLRGVAPASFFHLIFLSGCFVEIIPTCHLGFCQDSLRC